MNERATPIDTTPGYTDTAPHPATLTRWKYRAIYHADDAQVGLWSAEVSVTAARSEREIRRIPLRNTLIVFAIYVWFGAFSGPVTRFILPVTWIALGATIVESLPFKDIDNITLTVVSALIGHLVF